MKKGSGIISKCAPSYMWRNLFSYFLLLLSSNITTNADNTKLWSIPDTVLHSKVVYKARQQIKTCSSIVYCHIYSYIHVTC